MIFLFFVSLISVCCATNSTTDREICVSSNVSGKIVCGIRNDQGDQFLGLFYAQYPKRFSHSTVLPLSYSKINAKKFGAVCPQSLTAQIKNDYTLPADTAWDENCLTLNVFRYQKDNATEEEKNKLKPVFVWIHGGALRSGGNVESRLNGQHIAKTQNVIVVTINYRLGLFGFLGGKALLEEQTQLNFGFIDQTNALQWVQQNIALFGGDKTQVTIGGESAGASSVVWHLLHKPSKGLFSKAIIQSPAVFEEIQELADSSKQFTAVSTYVNCGSDPTLKCLRSKSTDELLLAQYAAFNDTKATIDGVVFEKHPYLLIQERDRVTVVPTIIGKTRNEGTIFVYGQYRQPIDTRTFDSIVETMIRDPETSKQFEHLYHCELDDCREALSNLVGEFTLMCASLFVQERMASYTPSHTFGYLFTNASMAVQHALPQLGAFHSCDVPFVFNTVKHASGSDLELSANVIHFWFSFVRTGSAESLTGAPQWPTYATESKEMLLGVPLSVEKANYPRCQAVFGMYNVLYGVPEKQPFITSGNIQTRVIDVHTTASPLSTTVADKNVSMTPSIEIDNTKWLIGVAIFGSCFCLIICLVLYLGYRKQKQAQQQVEFV